MAISEGDFYTLLQWETDGIFPRIYGYGAPTWYEEEKLRRGIRVTPVRIVSQEEFISRGRMTDQESK